MKHNCDVIRDLMPLYLDEVASEESQRMVEEHLLECQDCAAYFEKMKAPSDVENEETRGELDRKELASMKKAKKKMNKKKLFFLLGGILGGGALVYFGRKLILAAVGIIVLLLGSGTAKVQTFTDVENYTAYLSTEPTDGKQVGTDSELIFPDALDPAAEVLEFQYTYYNPWDAQHIAYLTVSYQNPEDFEKEFSRLSDAGIDRYEGYYSVTGAPSGYELAAMDADSYSGFEYALVPDSGELQITYVMIRFCNYFLDLDIHEVLPDRYLLQGFDASKDNPYREAHLPKD